MLLPHWFWLKKTLNGLRKISNNLQVKIIAFSIHLVSYEEYNSDTQIKGTYCSTRRLCLTSNPSKSTAVWTSCPHSLYDRANGFIAFCKLALRPEVVNVGRWITNGFNSRVKPEGSFQKSMSIKSKQAKSKPTKPPFIQHRFIIWQLECVFMY